MHVHRTDHVRNFTVLPNCVLQNRRLSYTARGLLVDLLSRPDGWREDGRQMADRSTQGRGTIRKALKELAEAGFYRVEKVRLTDGTFRTQTHVYDTPQLVAPDVTRPVAGAATAGPGDTPPVKDGRKEPSLPAAQAEHAAPQAERSEQTEPDEQAEPDAQTREAVAMLYRVIRPEPRLRLGAAEAAALAPLVAQWLERGSSASDLAYALLPGLPARVHSAVGVLRSRLERKMPPAEAPSEPSSPGRTEPSKPWYAECAECHDPVPEPGICRTCAGLGVREPAPGAFAAIAALAATGAARARTALDAARQGPVAVASMAV
ncbi:hypothetical protein SLA_3487 [Streptomyces laurentii]|uniref:Helix-turn-helix domain-containing protein n=1 Tax=Streptomyces laurentii TaxID=39478 RepID=A0A160P176_STRLU|nr:hypothetical protein SLA_3487 [Streptomyces laurentii]